MKKENHNLNKTTEICCFNGQVLTTPETKHPAVIIVALILNLIH